jgi:hypothetical protein
MDPIRAPGKPHALDGQRHRSESQGAETS